LVSPFCTRPTPRKDAPIATGQEFVWALQRRLGVMMKRKIVLLQEIDLQYNRELKKTNFKMSIE
jgi:hypothetical protein